MVSDKPSGVMIPAIVSNKVPKSESRETKRTLPTNQFELFGTTYVEHFYLRTNLCTKGTPMESSEEVWK